MTDPAALPDGHVTFLLTDIERSTSLLRQLGSERYENVLALHGDAIRRAIDAHGGASFKTEGDAFLVAFAEPSAALRAAIDLQRNLRVVYWPDDAKVRVRAALHSGYARVVGGDYVSLALHQASRLVATAHGGQIIATATVADEADGAVDVVRLGEFVLRDFEKPVELVEVRHPDLNDVFPLPLAQRPNSHNLPVSRTTFVGRGKEIDVLADLVAQTRCVALVGPGGAGKSRLAFEFATRHAALFGHGVWALPFGAVDTEPTMVSLLADVLGVTNDGQSDLLDTVIEHLKAQDVLLVFDNCEHVLDAAVRLAESVLNRCPAVRILATTRSPFRVDGAQQYRIPKLGAMDAVELFADRASRADAQFHRDPSSTARMGTIVEAIDHLPLAIELVAARADSLGLAGLAERIDDVIRADARADPRQSDERQRSLRATVGWSYRLLDERQRLLLGRLSVFRGGWPVGALEKVCADETLPADAIALLEADLIDASLVTVDSGDRHRLLAVVREYAAASLADGEHDKMVERLARWCAELTRQVDFGLQGWDEVPNIRTALASRVDPGLRAQIASRISQLWAAHGWADEAHTILEGVLAEPLGREDRTRTLVALGLIEVQAGRLDRGTELLEEAEAGIEGLEGEIRDRTINTTRHLRGYVYLRTGRYADAQKMFLAVEPSSETERLGVVNSLAMASVMIGDLDGALEAFLEASRLFDSDDHRLTALGNAAETQSRLGRDADAWSTAVDAGRMAMDIGFMEGYANTLILLGEIACRSGAPRSGTQLLACGENVLESCGLALYDSDRELATAAADRAREALGDDDFQHAWSAGRKLDAEEALRSAIDGPLPPALRSTPSSFSPS